jgi:hypothetical protein
MSLRHIVFVVRDMQRMWLHVWGILDYMEIYKPHMNGQAFPAAGIVNTIRTFMTSICVAQDMFLAGLPCWLIWESKTFGNKKIFSVAEDQGIPSKELYCLRSPQIQLSHDLHGTCSRP